MKDQEKQEEIQPEEPLDEKQVEEEKSMADEAEEKLVDEPEDILADQIFNLGEMVVAAQKEASDNLDGWQRTQAEFINYKKRVEREQSKMKEDASARIIKRFLDAMDDLDRALDNRPIESEGADWAAGIELVQRKMLNVLESEGVTPMEVEGEFFDPNLHEAIAQTESSDHKSGQIIEVIQTGYMIGERVLRPALVRVAS
jgi:molecular chaperone GrpE